MQCTKRSNSERQWTKNRVKAFFERGPDPACWTRRRWEIMKAIDQHAWDLESVVTLFPILGYRSGELDSTATHWRRKIREGRELAAFVDGFLTGVDVSPGLLTNRRLAARLSKAWLWLEVRFQPDERCCLADLRNRLIKEADRREIDLRGLRI